LYQSRRCRLSHAVWSHACYVSAAHRARHRVRTYGDRADEEAPRGEVQMLWRCMLLQLSAEHSMASRMAHTSFCAVNESGGRFAMSGSRRHGCERASDIGPLLSTYATCRRGRSARVDGWDMGLVDKNMVHLVGIAHPREAATTASTVVALLAGLAGEASKAIVTD